MALAGQGDKKYSAPRSRTISAKSGRAGYAVGHECTSAYPEVTDDVGCVAASSHLVWRLYRLTEGCDRSTEKKNECGAHK